MAQPSTVQIMRFLQLKPASLIDINCCLWMAAYRFPSDLMPNAWLSTRKSAMTHNKRCERCARRYFTWGAAGVQLGQEGSIRPTLATLQQLQVVQRWAIQPESSCVHLIRRHLHVRKIMVSMTRCTCILHRRGGRRPNSASGRAKHHQAVSLQIECAACLLSPSVTRLPCSSTAWIDFS